MESEQRGTKITKKILMMMLSLLMVLSMAALTGCGSNDSADAGESEANDDVVAEEEAAEEPAAPDLESLDEIQGHYELRPVEIWNMTADVTEGDGYYIMHVVTSENEYDYGLCDDGNAYFYDADSGELTDQLVYTYTFEKGVIAMTTLDENSTMSFMKAGAE